MNPKRLLSFAILSILLLSISCTKEGVDIEYQYYENNGHEVISKYLNLPAVPLRYTNEFPAYYSSTIFEFDKDLATLGRVLFYDKNLSEDRSISCGSCHRQELAFSDGEALSRGVAARRTVRNSLALGSVFSFREYYGSVFLGRVPFFWDNRVASVQDQSVQTFGNENEMSMHMGEVVDRVKEQPYYDTLFKAAYGSTQVNDQRVLDAISEFVNSIGSFNSKYDQELDRHYENYGNVRNIDQVDFSGLSAIENRGMDLYLANCGSCHGEINGLPGEIAANNGLDMEYEDSGIGALTSNTEEYGLFKVPTLRNIALTGPYMHDGRFLTLEEVLDHYSSGIQNHPNLGDPLKDVDGQPKQFNFSVEEREALIAFLNTFTDEKFLTDEKYADPFK